VYWLLPRNRTATFFAGFLFIKAFVFVSYFEQIACQSLLRSAGASPAGAYEWNTIDQIAVRDFGLMDLRCPKWRTTKIKGTKGR
jgi:hypothetical protein